MIRSIFLQDILKRPHTIVSEISILICFHILSADKGNATFILDSFGYSSKIYVLFNDGFDRKITLQKLRATELSPSNFSASQKEFILVFSSLPFNIGLSTIQRANVPLQLFVNLMGLHMYCHIA